MRCFAFRLFAALSFLLAQSLPVHAVESLSAFAWPSSKSSNYTLDAGVNGELTRRQGLAKTIESSPQAVDSDKIIWLKQVENIQRRAVLLSIAISGDLPKKFLEP